MKYTYSLTHLLTHSLTYSLTPKSRVILETVTGSELVTKFPADGSWPHLKTPITCPYPAVNEMCNLNGHERSKILGRLVRFEQIFQKSRSYFKILGAKMMTWTKFKNGALQIFDAAIKKMVASKT